VPPFEALAKEFAESAQFFTLWVREPHSGGRYPQPETIEQREQYAHDFCKADHSTVPVILDDMEGTIHRLFGYFPNSVVVLDERGRVAYRATWSDNREIRRIVKSLDKARAVREAGGNAGIPRWSEEIMPKLSGDPNSDVIKAFEIWEEAGNYDEPERFMGPERGEAFRQAYEKATGRKSIRPETVAARD